MRARATCGGGEASRGNLTRAYTAAGGQKNFAPRAAAGGEKSVFPFSEVLKFRPRIRRAQGLALKLKPDEEEELAVSSHWNNLNSETPPAASPRRRRGGLIDTTGMTHSHSLRL